MRAKNKEIIKWLWVLLMLPFIASSCTNDDDVVSYNDYCYIKSVTLGVIKRQVNDTKTSYQGNTFLMTINQRTGTIENRDPLPYGSQLSAVLTTIAFDGSMIKYRRKWTNDEWNVYNSTDSLNLTDTLALELYSNDGLSTRTYYMWVNVYQQEGDSLSWKQCETEVEELKNLTDMKAFVLNNKLMVLGINGTDTVLLERSGLEEQGVWGTANDEGQPIKFPHAADLQTLRQHNDTLYLSTDNGKVLYSIDAKKWKDTATIHSAPLTLIEKTDKYFYAISEGKILRHSVDAENTEEYVWKEDVLEPKAQTDSLPVSGIRALTMQQSNGSTRLVMLGQRDANNEQDKKKYSHCFVWNKAWNEGWKNLEQKAEWMYFPLSPDNDIPCPRLKHLNLLSYDGKCVAFGGASVEGYGEHEALDAVYVSRDFGITWRPASGLYLPAQLNGTDGCITAVVDKNNFIWIVTNAQVWRGRLNRLGFAQQ